MSAVHTAETLLALAVEAGPALTGLEVRSALERLEARCPDLVAALQTFIDHGKIDEAMRLAIALAAFWRVTKRLAEGCDAFDRCLRAPGGDEILRGRASYEAGMLAFWKGDDHASDALHRRAVEIGRHTGDPTTVALALCGLARIALRSDVAEARRLCREALAILEGTSDRLGRSSAIHVLGVSAQMAGDLLEAREFMRERIALAREMGSYAGVSMEASNLSMVERQLGNLDQAESPSASRWLGRTRMQESSRALSSWQVVATSFSIRTTASLAGTGSRGRASICRSTWPASRTWMQRQHGSRRKAERC